MKPGWIFTYSPVRGGRFLCIFETPNTILTANVAAENIYKTMTKMIKMCIEKKDPAEPGMRVH